MPRWPESSKKTDPVPQPVETKVEAAPVAAPVLTATDSPVTILSPLDSYIRERMKEQPSSLEEVVSRAEVRERTAPGQHRLQLPDFFQALSHDNVSQPGPYMFRWLFKDKRSIDRALNVTGWTLATRTYFPGAPRYLFTANGGVEIGDAILAFMPAKKALALREAPAQISQDKLKAQMTDIDQDYTLMTGNPKDEHVYQPTLGAEETETSEAPQRATLTEGRDF